MAIYIVDFPIKNGDFPWQNVSSPEGNPSCSLYVFLAPPGSPGSPTVASTVYFFPAGTRTLIGFIGGDPQQLDDV